MSAMSAGSRRCAALHSSTASDEVTGIVADARGSLMPAHVLARADVVWDDGHSDYGRGVGCVRRAFLGFADASSSLVITGDARSNYRAPNLAALTESLAAFGDPLGSNPSAVKYWDTGDSVMSQYARACHTVHEVRTLRQLEAAAVDIATGARQSPVHSPTCLNPTASSWPSAAALVTWINGSSS